MNGDYTWKQNQKGDLKMSDEFLSHHGILGQKWGKLNGPPYPLGKGDHSSSEKQAASNAGIKVGEASHERYKRAFGTNKDHKKSNAEKITNSTSNIVDNMKSINRSMNAHKSRANQVDLSKYSDTELRQKIDRMTLETRYKNLLSEKKSLDNGKITTSEILDVVGSYVAITASVATIATAVYKIKNG